MSNAGFRPGDYGDPAPAEDDGRPLRPEVREAIAESALPRQVKQFVFEHDSEKLTPKEVSFVLRDRSDPDNYEEHTLVGVPELGAEGELAIISIAGTDVDRIGPQEAAKFVALFEAILERQSFYVLRQLMRRQDGMRIRTEELAQLGMALIERYDSGARPTQQSVQSSSGRRLPGR